MKKRTLGVFTFCLASVLLSSGLALRTEAMTPGALDPTFGTNGRVVTDISNRDGVRDIAVQSDGKIVAVGFVSVLNQSTFAIVRYNANGSLDTTFDSDGILTIDLGASNSANRVALQQDGKIVVAGLFFQTSTRIALVRLNPNGSLDSTFDGDGKLITDFDGSASSVQIQVDGKIVVGSGTEIIRFNPTGSLDSTFGTGGRANVNVGVGDIALQSDGKIVGVGGSNNDYAVYRVTTTGAPDTTFDADGIATTHISGDDFAGSVAIQPDGKIIAAGGSNGGSSCSMAKYNPEGSLDATFDGDGKVLVDFIPTYPFERVVEIKMQTDGKIVAAVFIFNGNFLSGLGAARFNSNGSLDTSFSGGGLAFVAGLDETKAAAISGNNVLVAGHQNNIEIIQINLVVKPSASSDFDGDGFPDSAIFRPSNGRFYILNSSNGTVTIANFGTSGDVPVDGDFNGDGKTDIGIYRPSTGQWWISGSSGGLILRTFGLGTDKPVPGDYDKDGKSDIAVWRPSNGNYFVLTSSSDFSAFFSYPWGLNGDIPVGAAIAP